jgi:hypothetical protein
MGTGNLESVELIKAPQPDQDANAVAGFVNLVSRRAFDLPGRRVTVTGGVLWRDRGFNNEGPFRDRPDGLDLFSLAYSDVSMFSAATRTSASRSTSTGGRPTRRRTKLGRRECSTHRAEPGLSQPDVGQSR